MKSTNEEKALCNIILYRMFTEWAETAENEPESDREERQEYLDAFVKKTGAKKNSPAYYMYMGFIAGAEQFLTMFSEIDAGKGGRMRAILTEQEAEQ